MALSSIINHNKKITELTTQLKQDIETIEKTEDIFSLVEKVKNFGQPLEYNNNIPYFIITCLVLVIIYLFNSNTGSEAPNIICIIITVSLIIWVLVRKNSITDLSKQLFLKKLYFDNNLFPVSFNGEQLAHELKMRFNVFDKGNYQRKIEALYKGSYQGKQHNFEYHHYKFHYVDKEIKTTKDSNGNTKTETVYHHYYHYGIILNFPYLANLSIKKTGSSFSKATYQPSSNEFNRYYKVFSDSEMTAAKFLKPTVVIAFEDIHAKFKGIHFEFNTAHELCMSYDDKNTINHPQQYNLTNAAAFLKELQQPIKPNKLKEALEHIEQLMIYSDNNFSN